MSRRKVECPLFLLLDWLIRISLTRGGRRNCSRKSTSHYWKNTESISLTCLQLSIYTMLMPIRATSTNPDLGLLSIHLVSPAGCLSSTHATPVSLRRRARSTSDGALRFDGRVVTSTSARACRDCGGGVWMRRTRRAANSHVLHFDMFNFARSQVKRGVVLSLDIQPKRAKYVKLAFLPVLGVFGLGWSAAWVWRGFSQRTRS